MTERVRWTCLDCGKTYAVPTTAGLTVWPQCNLPTASKATAVSVTLNRSALIGIMIAIAAVGYLAGLASSASLFASRRDAAPAGKIERPRIGAKATDPDKAAVEEWLRKNLDDGAWEEVEWWPAFDQTEALKKKITDLEQQIKNDPQQSGLARIELDGLRMAPSKIARLRYRIKKHQEQCNCVIRCLESLVIAQVM